MLAMDTMWFGRGPCDVDNTSDNEVNHDKISVSRMFGLLSSMAEKVYFCMHAYMQDAVAVSVHWF